MAQREWVEKDFYKELGVSSDASEQDIKRAARKLLAENHPDRNPSNQAAEDRYRAVSEAKEVLTDPAKRKEYDETRRLFANGGFGRGRFSGGNFGGFGGDGVDGVHVYAPDGTKIGQILMPEGTANLCFVGRNRNRLFMTSSQSVYTLYTAAQGAHIT